MGAGGSAIGLVAGGVLTQALNWHWIFFVNVPIGITALALGALLIPRDRGIGIRMGADVAGAVLVTAALMLSVYTIVQAADHGWNTNGPLTAAAFVLLAAFVARQATARNPLLTLSIFRSRSVSGANAIQILSVAGMFGMFFLGALYMQRVLGYGPMSIGLAFLPFTVVFGAVSVALPGRMSRSTAAGAFCSPVSASWLRDCWY